ncbi:hypothetical protein AAVH_32948, partial [Aphelenchoides avenae]
KKEGNVPEIWSKEWRKHKLGKWLWTRYKKYNLEVHAREVDARRGLTPAAAAQQPSSSTTTIEQSAVVSSSSSAPATTADPTAPLALTAELCRELTEDEIMILDTNVDTTEAAQRATEQFAEELFGGQHDHILDEHEADEHESVQEEHQDGQPQEPMDTANPPPALPAHNAGAEDGTGPVAAHNAAPVPGTIGEAVRVPNERPPLIRAPSSQSQSGAEDRSRQQSVKRSRPATGTTRSPPAQRGRVNLSLSPDRASPGLDRHRTRRSKEKGHKLSAIIDARVFKDSAVVLVLEKKPFTQWTDAFQNLQYEYLGYISAFQVPWAYLRLGQYKNLPEWQALHRLRDVTLDEVLKENARLPHRYVLGYTFGVDPWLYEMVTSETRQHLTIIAKQKYYEPAPGVKLRVLGIGPTGFYLVNCAEYDQSFRGQWTAFVRLARAALESGKCLSLCITKDEKAGDVDLHEEARKALYKIELDRNHPIHLQEYQASYADLCGWLEQFPNTVVTIDLGLLENLQKLIAMPDHHLHGIAMGMLEFFKLAPLENIVVQSGAYSLRVDNTARQPPDLLKAADLLEDLTGTPSAVYLETAAANTSRVYQLNAEFLDQAYETQDTSPHQRCTRENLRRTIEVNLFGRGYGRAPRADQDQEEEARPSSTGQPAHNAGAPPGAGTEAIVVPNLPPPRSQSAQGQSRSPRERSPKEKVEEEEKGRKPRPRHKKAEKVKSPKADQPSTSKKARSRSSGSSLSTGSARRSRSPSKATAKGKRKDESTRSKSRSPIKKAPPSHRRESRSSSRSRRSSRHSDRRDRRSSSHRRKDDERRDRDAERRREDRRRDERRREEEERRRKDRLRDEERRKYEERRRDDRDRRDRRRSRDTDRTEDDRRNRQRSPARGNAARRDDERRRSSTGSPAPQRRSEVFVVPPPPPVPAKQKPRAPIAPPSRDQSPSTSHGSSRSDRTYVSRMKGRVMIPVAVPPAHNAGAPYQVIPRKERLPAHNADVAPAVRRTTARDLLREHPLPAEQIERPSEEDIEAFFEDYLGEEEDPDRQVRSARVSEFSTTLIDPPQLETFSVPPEPSWHPENQCNGEGEDPIFHQTCDKGRYIPVKRWKTSKVFTDAALLQMLMAIGEMSIYTFGHMIIVTWAVRLKNKDDRVAHITEFLYHVLQSFDWEKEIPALLAAYQPRMVAPNTTDPWPSEVDFRIGAERWTCCCEHAYRYIFNHLTGPSTWAPQWLQTANVPPECSLEIRTRMINEAETMFNNLRHVVYRQYVLRHVNAALTQETFFWKRFDIAPDRETTRGKVCLDAYTIVFAEDPVYVHFSAFLRDSVRMVAIRNGTRAAIRETILNCFPGHSVRRVVFWLGRDYIVDGNNTDYDELIRELCHVYTENFGFVEQFVVLPPYPRTHRDAWTNSALRLIVQQEDLVPYARVAMYTNDFQYWDHDRRRGITSAWLPVYATTEDGNFRAPKAIEGRKLYLSQQHGLDLWTTYAKAPKDATLLDYTSASIPASARVEAAHNAAPPKQRAKLSAPANIANQPSTSAAAAAAASTSKAVAPSAAHNAAERNLRRAPPAVLPNFFQDRDPALPGTVPFLTPEVTAILRQQAEMFQQLQQTLLTQFASQAAPSTTEPPKKSSSRKHDKDSDRRD